MTQLIHYDAACTALAHARKVDEVKTIRDKAEAVRTYARIANNRSLEIDAAEIRVRAERKLGEMLSATKEAGLLSKGGSHPKGAPTSATTLKKLGVDKKLSMRAQKLASIPPAKFEENVRSWRKSIESQPKSRVTPGIVAEPTVPTARRSRGSGAAVPKLSDGRNVVDLRYDEVPGLLRKLQVELKFLKAIQSRGVPPRLSQRIGEVLGESTLLELFSASQESFH